MKDREALIRVRDLKMHFPGEEAALFRRKKKPIKAVDGISFEIYQGETLGLVGESGCGKTTTGNAILQLYRPTAGTVTFDGQELTELRGEKLRNKRQHMQMIFQDPYSSLNPRWTISRIISEPMRVHQLYPSRKKRMNRVRELLEMVQINLSYLNRYPHEFSGGQRQRIGVARALASNPAFIVCDEPISALDVSIQAQVVNLLEDLQQKLGLTYLFIAHDLSMVRQICDRVAVMYLGKILEIAEKESLYENPLHPYTQALLSAIPIPDPVITRQRKRILLSGDPPSPADPPTGCRFHTRCSYMEERCRVEEPPLRTIEPNHQVACHFV